MDSQQLELFVLAKDRSQALEQLIPGTEAHYFHACLVAEQAGNLEAVDSLLAQWNKRHGETALFCEVRNRLQLLRYEENPAATLEYLRYHLGLQWNHERIVEGQETKYPSRLDESVVSREEIKRHGFKSSNSADLSGFTDAALEWLVEEPIEGQRLRSLLLRLQRPDYQRLPELVAAELADTRHSGGFGAIPIHNLMLQEQLEKLGTLVPGLLNNEHYVHARLQKLHPGPDVDWQNNPAEHEAFLNRLWALIKGLLPKWNALKAHVLYHRLELDRRLGVRDRERFIEYLKLPRQVAYANPDYLKRFKRDEPPFKISEDFHAFTLHPVVSSDEELVNDYLAHFLADAEDSKPFETWIQEGWLRTVFASTKMLLGKGDKAHYYAMLNDPAFCQAQNDRVELSFAKENREWFAAHDEVALVVDVKNVPALTIKVFEINALNYFLATGRDVDTSIDLDGLMAGEEQTYKYSEPPIRRVRRSFTFPALRNPGVYIVELIGGGISSRALLRKGRLRFLERVGSAGHVFTVLDEERNVCKEATIWLGGREYTADADGEIAVPFSTSPGRQTLLLRHGTLTTLEQFEHQGENYRLFAGMYVDRESLLKKKEAQLVLRPALQVNGIPVSLSLLEEPTLIIQSTDREGTSARQEVRDFKLLEDRESVHPFVVPEQLSALSFTFLAKVQSLSQNQKLELSCEHSVSLNGIESAAAIEDVHLAHTAAGYILLHAGKSGEKRAGTVLSVQLRHRDLVPLLDLTLKTDADGRVELGQLRDITSLTVFTPSGVSETWTLPRDRCRLNRAVHVRAGEAFVVPFLDTAMLGALADAPGQREEQRGAPAAAPASTLKRSDACLLSALGATFVRDHFDALRQKDGYLQVAGLPAGDYLLFLKRDATAIRIRVVPGTEHDGWVAGEKRHLERKNPRPLQVSAAVLDDTQIRITIGNANERTRVHVFGTRFVPAYAAFFALGSIPVADARAVEVSKAQSHYVSGRDIGDEYRYILERKQSQKFAGNLLPRPGLLLNPWAIRSTETATQAPAVGGAFAASAAPAMAAPCPPPPPKEFFGESGGSFANLDFLENPAAVLLNLKPDAHGVITLPRDALQHVNTLRVVAIDTLNTVCRDVLLDEVKTPPKDLRLRLALDAEKHFSEKKQVTVLPAGQPLEIADIVTAKVEVYDTLARVYRLYASLSNNAELAKFAFILKWPRLTEDEKRARYSEFACHELSFFVAQKDPEWFARVVRPYLRNKQDKTFLDHFLLENDLTRFRRPWAFSRLNIVERILLAQRCTDEGESVARHARDLFDLLPRDIERRNHLFGSAIAGSALDAGDRLGIAQQSEVAELALSARFEDASLGSLGPGQARSRGGAGLPPPAAAKPAMRAAVSKELSKKRKSESPRDLAADEDSHLFSAEGGGGGDRDDYHRGEKDMRSRGKLRPLYQKLDKTKEWAENHYWHLPIEQQGPELVTINPLWRDYAHHRGQGPFLSPHLAYATRNFTEMMFALSLLDLPFEAERPQVEFAGAHMKLCGKTPAVAFHKEIQPVEPSAQRVPILVSQNYFRDDDRTREENGEAVDKYVTGELLVNVVYTCQVVLTNPTSTNQKLDLLLQLPAGAIPVRNGFYTKGRHLELSSYNTESIEYSFYFPQPGRFAHFPVHVAKDEKLIASAAPVQLDVVAMLSNEDRQSWAWLSQHGAEADVLSYLDAHNADRLARVDGEGRVDLELIAWRMKDRRFYEQCIALLNRRHIYNDTLFSYTIYHDDRPNLREFLLHQEGFLDKCGAWLDSALISIDPVERGRYQHLEYAPLVNARTQKLGARRTLLNGRFAEQYGRLLNVLRYRRTLTDADKLALTYYLLLQDRIDEALELWKTVEPHNLESLLQYDYMQVYADFCREQPAAARKVAERHQDEPIDRWRNLFKNALAQIEEISGTAGAFAVTVVDEKDREQRQAGLAASEPDFDFSVENKDLTLHVRNLAAVTVNYYRMDIELLFSRQPFVQQQSGQFSFIKPNRSDELRLAAGDTQKTLELPPEFQGKNVIVEVVAAGRRKFQVRYAHDLLVNLIENYGQLRVGKKSSGQPLARTYVKVYARMKSGEVKFYKDGYTDLRGAFDYSSLNTNELDYVERFSMLVLSEDFGAVIREAGPSPR